MTGALNANVDKDIIDHLSQATAMRYGPALLEFVPSPQQVSDFFDDIQARTTVPLQDRLRTDAQDGTVFLTHETANHTINLSTITHDYTHNTSDTYVEGWQTATQSHETDLITLVKSAVDGLQAHLLQLYPTFLHAVRQADRTVSVYTAYRFSDVAEPTLELPQIGSWRPVQPTDLRPATRTEATIWVICHLVRTTGEFDFLRHKHINAVLRAIFETVPTRRTLPPGHSLHLLQARRQADRLSRFGRLRFPVMRAVVTDRAVLRTGGKSMSTSVTEPPEQYDIRGVHWKIKLARLALSLIFLGIVLYVAIRFTTRSTHRTIVVIFWVLVALSVGETLLVATSKTCPKNAPELVKLAQKGSMRFQIEAACSDLAHAQFNGAWLSFAPGAYAGSSTYDGRKFNISDLMRAGFETSLAMDGREVLVSPAGTEMRLACLGSDGGAVFEPADSISPMLPSGVVPGVRATWLSDIFVSADARGVSASERGDEADVRVQVEALLEPKAGGSGDIVAGTGSTF